MIVRISSATAVPTYTRRVEVDTNELPDALAEGAKRVFAPDALDRLARVVRPEVADALELTLDVTFDDGVRRSYCLSDAALDADTLTIVDQLLARADRRQD